MQIDTETRIVTLDTEPCTCTMGNGIPGTQPGRKTCPVCNGTRRGPRGKANGCRNCYEGTVTDFDNRVTCVACNGSTRVPERSTSSLNKETRAIFWSITPIRVVTVDRAASFNEQYLGLGTLFSVGDYGTAWEGMKNNREATIKKITDEVRANNHMQLCTVANKEHRLCDEVVVTVTKGGYAPRPNWTAVPVAQVA